MLHFPLFKRKFLKKAAYVAVMLLAAAILFAAVIQHFFSEAEVKRQLQIFADERDLVLSFDEAKLERHWLPYPEVMLHGVRLGRNGGEAGFSAKELSVRLKWSLLWGAVTPGRVMMKGVEASWIQGKDGHWSLGGMDVGRDDILPDRIVWESAVFSAVLRGKSMVLTDSSGLWEKGGDFRIEGNLGGNNPYVGTHLELEGRYEEGQLPYLYVSADAAMPGGGRIHLDWSGSAAYDSSSGRLSGHDTVLKLNVPDWRLEADGQIQAWQLAPDKADWTNIRLTFASNYADLSNNGSIRFERLHWADGVWTLPSFRIESVFAQQRGETTVTVGGNFWRGEDGSFRMEHLEAATRYLPDSGSLPLFVGQWQGEFGGNSSRLWSGKLTGTLDGAAALLTVSAQNRDQRPIISAEADFTRLALRPYLAGVDTATGIPEAWIGSWRHLIRDRLLELTVKADLLEGAGIRAEKLDMSLYADADGMETDRLNLNLYGGNGKGRAVLKNRPHTEWSAEMDFQGVDIKPLLQDMFRFNHLGGHGNAVINLSAKGLTSQQWRESLNGKIDIRVHKGNWRGIDFVSLLPSAGAASGHMQLAYDDTRQTAFDDFEAQAYLENGIGYTPVLTLRGKDVRLNGEGSFDIIRQTLDYAVLLDSGENRWLPLKIGGSPARPELTLDYARVVEGLDTVAQKQAALRAILNRQWQLPVRSASQADIDAKSLP